MVGVQNQQLVHDGGVVGVSLVKRDGRLKHHVQKVFAIAVAMAGINKRLADGFLVGKSGDGAQFGKQPRDGDVQLFRVAGAVQLGIETGKRNHHGGQHGHGMRAFGKFAEEANHVLVQHGMGIEQTGKLLALLLIGQFAENEQIGHFGE